MESKTVIVTKSQRDTIPVPAAGVKSQLGSWMSESDWQRARQERFPGCMAGTVRACTEGTRRRARAMMALSSLQVGPCT